MRALIFALLATTLHAKTYPVDGIIIALDPLARTFLVSHRPIPNYMPAMAMPFRVATPAELHGLQPGDRLTFKLVVEKDHTLARALRRTEAGPGAIPPPKERLPLGTLLPHFSLTNQSGQTITLASLRGQILAIDFIYTRCPLPDVCPRLSASFATVARRLRGRPVTFISVTVDPDYDTPEILAEYARRWGADKGAPWHFLTGDVSRIAAPLGEVYWTDEGSIGHNSATAIVDAEGRLAATLEGSSWRADQLERLILHQLEK